MDAAHAAGFQYVSEAAFDQLAAFQNFLIMPLTFLSGVFYSTHSLPPVWREISRYDMRKELEISQDYSSGVNHFTLTTATESKNVSHVEEASWT